jgi:hypothetical protein
MTEDLKSPAPDALPDASPSPESTSGTSPQTTPDLEPGFGWTAYAERINGRFAMVGLVLLVLLEWVTHQDFLTWAGLR